eukprot:scaffold7885_cov69-Phaeocystis_antarctica.AAC.1
MFSAFAPFARVTIAPAPTIRSPVICRIQTSVAVAVPLNVREEVKPTLEPHLYSPGARVIPSMVPAPRSSSSGFTLPAASVYAVSMSLMAVVILDGVGLV